MARYFLVGTIGPEPTLNWFLASCLFLLGYADILVGQGIVTDDQIKQCEVEQLKSDSSIEQILLNNSPPVTFKSSICPVTLSAKSG